MCNILCPTMLEWDALKSVACVWPGNLKCVIKLQYDDFRVCRPEHTRGVCERQRREKKNVTKKEIGS